MITRQLAAVVRRSHLPWFAGLGLLFAGPAAAVESAELFRDVSQPIERRLDDLIGRLTLEEKAIVLNHRGPTIERFALRADQWNQCLNGVKWDRPTTLFPTCIAMAATWDVDLVHEIADTLSTEARAIYNGWHLDPKAPGEHKGLIYRAPVINIGRNPYWGRNHEAWGEDPFLVGRMAVAYVQGLQGDDPRHLKIAATLKHYAVNNVETDRQKLNAVVSERMLHEYWLPHFRDAVVEARAQSLMASYNALNGTPNNINRWLLTDLLKTAWHHDGFVVSDLGGVRTMVNGHAAGTMTYVDAVAQSVMAGCDFSDKEYQEHIPVAVREGKLSLERVDDAVRRVLRTRMKLGEFDPFESVSYSAISPTVIGSEPHRAVALQAAQESIVLLKNDGVLPLDRKKLKRLAVIGPLADTIVLNNYSGKPGQTVTALQGIRDRAGSGIEVLTARGCEITGTSRDKAIDTKVDREVGFSGGEGVKFGATAAHEFIEFTVNPGGFGDYQVTLIYKGAPNRGRFQLSHEGEPIGSPVDQYAVTMAHGQIARLGTVKLRAGPQVLRFAVVGRHPASTGFSGSFDQLVLTGRNEQGFEVESLKRTTGEIDTANPIPAAVALGRTCDAVIVCVGTDRRIEHEGRDRKTLGLSGRQEELVHALIAANPRTIVVQMSAGPLAVPAIEAKAPAILQAWWGGEEGGHALADILFGNANPAGRLPHTVYADDAQVPSLAEYDISKGFTYMYVKSAPLYAFGHGLSYTAFGYSGLRLSRASIKTDGAVDVSIEITNTGRLPGDEVVQLYIHDIAASVVRPVKELRGFRRIRLKPAEKRTITFTVPAEKLAFWDEKKHIFVVEPGSFEIMVGASSADIRARAILEVLKD
jgi:beta-glucosidase